MPPTNEMIGRERESVLIVWLACATPAAITKKGTARPTENTPSKKAPCQAVVVEDAKKSTEPKIGPTQGVQLNANVAPKKKELQGLPGFKNEGNENR